MSKLDCLNAILSNPKFKDIGLNEKNVLDLINEVDEQLAVARAAGIDPKKAITEILTAKKKTLARERINRADSLLKLKTNMDIGTSEAFADSGKRAAQSVLSGANHKAPGLGISVDTSWKSKADTLTAMFNQGLEAIGGEKIIAAKHGIKEIMMELGEMRAGGKPGRSGSKQALEIAKVIHKVQDHALTMLQDAGAMISRIDGYIMRQAHNSTKILALDKDINVAFNKWSDFVWGRLDHARTFGDLADADKMKVLREIFDDITSDEWSAGLGGVLNDELITIKSEARLAKRLSKERTLHFDNKKGTEFFEYNEQFGTQDLMTAVRRTIDRTARQAALMERFGPNPEAGFAKFVDRLAKWHVENGRGNVAKDLIRDADLKGQGLIASTFKELRGDTARPGTGIIGKGATNLVALNQVTQLGGAFFTQFADLASAAVTLRSKTGDNLFSSHLRAFTEFMKPFSPDKRKFVAQRLNVVMDDFLGGMAGRYGTDASAAGGLSTKIVNKFFKYNLMEFQFNKARSSGAMIFSGDLGDAAKLKFGELDSVKKVNLAQYGIDEAHWDIIRQGKEQFQGLDFITPEAIKELPDSAFQKFADDNGVSIRQARKDISGKVQGYFTDAVNDYIPTPGAKENAFFLRGMGVDTPWGAAAKLIKQYKTVMLAIHRVHSKSVLMHPDTTAKSLGEVAFGGNPMKLAERGDMQNFLGFAISSTILGYVSLSAANIAKGKNPPSLETPEQFAQTFLKAFGKGGGAYLMTDLLVSDYNNNMFRSAVKDVAGPGFGRLEDIWKLGQSLAAAPFEAGFGEDDISTIAQSKASDIFDVAMRQIPGQNIFWSKTMLDYLFVNELHDHLNPGWAEKQARKVEEDEGYLNLPGLGEIGNPTQGL